jgi:hypothetical protein
LESKPVAGNRQRQENLTSLTGLSQGEEEPHRASQDSDNYCSSTGSVAIIKREDDRLTSRVTQQHRSHQETTVEVFDQLEPDSEDNAHDGHHPVARSNHTSETRCAFAATPVCV